MRQKEKERHGLASRSGGGLTVVSSSDCRDPSTYERADQPGDRVIFPVGEGSREAKRTILLEDIIYAEKGRVATALVAKWGPTLSYIPAWIASVRVRRHRVPGDSRYALLRVIPICRWHPPRRQQHRGPFRLRSSLPLSDHERAGEGNRLRLREK